ncbi:DUF899 domain-containing protein [Planctomicrobium piriforme]|uniref:Predicted dithiol-disulfide oxidoreductase, DUF899 family n=1 Tax=Planctomicrobium piriforme TaxID=1576369 RepID=A0A1I3T690_9PLAN|nr:DUF899 domain-containing protein [Planctomicrobium piriforme]SFJ65331.1 Predicted dithiol-disulfide oxidoreductase, DUF899 family [Planctomicrobium piriforme]
MTTTAAVPHPPIVSAHEWEAARKQLLAEEKSLTQHKDRVNAQRRRLPMVLIEKDYAFDGPDGPVSLLDLFEGRQQLIVYHFMFDPAWDKGCPGCTGLVNAMGDLSMLNARQTTLALISRAPLEKLLKYKQQQGWNRTWVSSFNNRFNYDFHVTLDKSVVPLEYNFRKAEELESRQAAEPWFLQGESHGTSVFFRIDDNVYHTYSTYARGCESLTDSYSLLDITPYGRQEDFEDSPAGWPQKPTYGG